VEAVLHGAQHREDPEVRDSVGRERERRLPASGAIAGMQRRQERSASSTGFSYTLVSHT
jgi:hypothetical protein